MCIIKRDYTDQDKVEISRLSKKLRKEQAIDKLKEEHIEKYLPHLKQSQKV